MGNRGRVETYSYREPSFATFFHYRGHIVIPSANIMF
jgi:hypothetical protein